MPDPDGNSDSEGLPDRSGTSCSPELAWHDATPFDRQAAQTIEAFEAIRRSVTERRPLGDDTDDFLDVCGFTQSESGAFERVWRSPAATAWTRRTFETLRAHYAGHVGSEALRDQLDTFSVFAMAVAQLTGATRVLPVSIELPITLPGTTVTIEGEGAVRTTTDPGVTIAPLPVVRCDGATIALSPELLLVPGAAWPEAKHALSAGRPYQTRHAGTLETAVRLIQRDQPETFEQLKRHLDVVAFRPIDAQPHADASSSLHPGAMLLGGTERPHEMAGHLIRQHYHNRLFALEALGPLLESDRSGLPAERFYSPWHDEPRTMRALVHGAYAVVPVHRFWTARLADPEIAADVRDFARDRALEAGLQLALALEQIEAHAAFSPWGRAVFENVEPQTRAIREALDPDGGSEVRARVQAHRAQHGPALA